MRIINPEADDLWELAVAGTLNNYQHAESLRYGTRDPYQKEGYEKFDEILFPADHGSPRHQTEFRANYRVSIDNFWRLHERIKDHPVFKERETKGRKQAPAKYQLLVLLYYLGTNGNGASYDKMKSFFEIGKGSIPIFRDRALKAVLSLRSEEYRWPDVAERQAISATIQDRWHFPSCVGFIDGTLLPLWRAPGTNPHNYYTRKQNYCLQMLVICDHTRRINYFHVGWPGSVHDNRVWRNSIVHKKPAEFFSKNEYLLGDSAYVSGPNLIPAYRSNARVEGATSEELVQFNRLLARPRVKSEHCIGHLKQTFAWLKDIRQYIRNEYDMKPIIDLVTATVILHNFLLDSNSEDSDSDEEDENIAVVGADEPEDAPDEEDDGPEPAMRERILEYLRVATIIQ